MPRSRFCPNCGFLREGPIKQTVMHFRVCIPKREWPDELRHSVDRPIEIHTPTAAEVMPRPISPIEALHYADKIAIAHQAALTCACGFQATTEPGLKRHRKQAAIHKHEDEVLAHRAMLADTLMRS